MIAPPLCPYCRSGAVLCDASAVYGPAFEGKGNIWACANYPDCDSYTGAKPGLLPDPTGILANAELRGLHRKLRAANSRLKGIGFMNEDQARRALMALVPSGGREDQQ